MLQLSCAERVEAVNAFNERYGEMERALWVLSTNCRKSLLLHESSPVLEALVWTLKSWWGVQGVTAQAKPLIAQALTELEWTSEMFDVRGPFDSASADWAADRVGTVVARSLKLGLPRREFSLCSKTLHWLLPWRVPVYDNFVRQVLEVSDSLDLPDIYRTVARRIFREVKEIDAGDDCEWLGDIEPLSPLRGLDKCLWWRGGGESAPSGVKDPWGPIRGLGL